MGKIYKRTPGVAVPYQKDWQRLPLEYKRLAIEEMTQDDLEFALSELSTIIDGVSAQRYAISNADKGWSFKALLDVKGVARAIVVMYKGIEVKKFFERQVTRHRVLDGAPLSASRMKDPNDVWLSQELHGLSVRQQKKPTITKLSSLSSRILMLERQLSIKEKLNEKLEEQLDFMKKELKEVKEKSRKLKQSHEHTGGEENGKKKTTTKTSKTGKRNANVRRTHSKNSKRRKR